MDYLKPAEFKQLKAYFLALKESNYHPKLIPSSIEMGGARIPIDKTRCLELLHSFPGLEGKSDNQIFDVLSDPKKVKSILDQLPSSSERNELGGVLESKPVTTEGTSQQLSSQEVSTGQGIPAQTPPGESPSTMAGGGFAHIPSASSVPGTIYNIPRAPSKPAIPATDKINRLRPATAKVERLQEQVKTFNETRPAAASPGLGFRSGFGSNFRTVGSKAGIFFKNNSGRIAGGLGNIAGGVGRGIVGPGLTGTYNILGKAGNGGINAFANLSNQVSRRAASLKGIAKPSGKLGGRFALAGLLAVFLFVFVSGIIGGITGSTPTGEATPLPNNTSNGLGYTLPLRDPSIQPLDIKSQVRAAFPGAKLEYWDDPIIKRGKEAGWNPALVLALWIEETGASHTTLTKNGGSEIPVNGDLTRGHLGCAPTEDQTINESLDCLFKNFKDYTNDQFGQFMARYSGGPVNAPFSNNPNFTTNIRKWYSLLVPSGIGVLQPVTVPPAIVPVLPPGADYVGEISKNFHINFASGKFTENHLRWSWEILSQAKTIAPNFFNLINTVTVDTHSQIGERSGNTIFFSTAPNSFFSSTDESGFKVLLIHELGHVIRGDPSPTQQNYDSLLQQAVNKDGGYLTGYGQFNTNGTVCTGTLAVDEDFAETVAYYINRGTPEKDLACGQKSFDGLNPLYSGRYPSHMSFIQSILGISSTSQ